MQSQKKENKKIFSFIDGISYPFMQIAKNFKPFCLLICLTSIIVTIMTIFNSVVVHALAIFLGAIFVFSRWGLISTSNNNFLFSIKAKTFKRDFKVMLFYIIYMLLWVSGFVAIKYLNGRIPSENWIEELVIFTGIAIAVLVIAWTIINAYRIIFFLNKEKSITWREAFWPIYDNIYMFLGWFLVYSTLFMTLIYKTAFFFMGSDNIPFILKKTVGEFSLSAVYYIMVVCFYSLLEYQANQLKKAISSEK